MSKLAVRDKPKASPKPTADVLLPNGNGAIGGCTLVTPNHQVIHVPHSALTSLTGFRAWAKSDDVPEQVRITFVDGEVFIDMSGEEVQHHVIVKTAICIPLGGLVQDRDLGLFDITGLLISNEAARVSNVPDAVFAFWQTLASGRACLSPRAKKAGTFDELVGTPDWVLEIVSDSSVNKDTNRLRHAYHRAGIPEYWLVDARGDDISCQILVHEPEGYVNAPARGGWQTSRVFRKRFRLTRRRGKIGLWQYVLHIK